MEVSKRSPRRRKSWPDNAARYEYLSIQLAVFTPGKTLLEDHVRNRKRREHPDNCALLPLPIDSRIKRQLIILLLLMDLFSASSAFLKARVRAIPLNIHRLRTTAMFIRI